MARDYKNRSSRKGGTGGGRLTGLLIFVSGLVTGLCAAIIVYLLNGIPSMDRLVDKQTPVVAVPSKDDTDRKAAETADDPKPKGTPTPKFDFYTILPEMEVSVPEWDSETKAQDTTSDGAVDEQSRPPLEQDQRYILQVGSFRQPDEADRVKAKLALIGIEAQIQRVVIDGGDVWHRVRVGPYQSTDKLHQTRQRLIENDIDFMLLRLKQEAG